MKLRKRSTVEIEAQLKRLATVVPFIKPEHRVPGQEYPRAKGNESDSLFARHLRVELRRRPM